MKSENLIESTVDFTFSNLYYHAMFHTNRSLYIIPFLFLLFSTKQCIDLLINDYK